MRITNNQQNTAFKQNLIVTFAEGAEKNCNPYTVALDLARSKMVNPIFPIALDKEGRIMLVTDNLTPLGQAFTSLSHCIQETKERINIVFQSLGDARKSLGNAENSYLLAPARNALREIAELIQKDRKTTVHLKCDKNGVVKRNLFQKLFGWM